MNVLSNSRHEAFARKIAAGASAVSAYKSAYDTTLTNATANAHRLTQNDGARRRVIELQELAASKLVLSIQQKREYLADIVRTPIGEIDENSILCQTVEYVTTGGQQGKLRRGNAESGNEASSPEATVVKVKMPDKLRAIQLDNELAGHVKIVDRSAVNVSMNVMVLTDEDRSRLMEKKQPAIARRAALAGNKPAIPSRTHAERETIYED